MTRYLKWTTQVMCPACGKTAIPKRVYKSEEYDDGEWLDLTYGGECVNCNAWLQITHEFKHSKKLKYTETNTRNSKSYGWCVKQWINDKYGTWVKDTPYCYREVGTTKWEKYYD